MQFAPSVVGASHASCADDEDDAPVMHNEAAEEHAFAAILEPPLAPPAACDAEEPPFDPPDEDDIFGESVRSEADDPNATERVGELLLTAVEGSAGTKACFGAESGESAGPPRRAPFISVHASWDRLDSARQLGDFAADWRMARADITLERGGVEGAAARFAAQSDPDLLIIDTTLTGRELLASLVQFAPMVTRGAKLIVIGAVNDIILLRQLAARGIAYIVPPFSADELVRMVCERFAAIDRSRVIAVIGARGGVGASTIAHNLAWSIAEQQRAETTLVDFDLCFSAATLHLEQRPAQSIADALRNPHAIDDDALEALASKRGQRLKFLAAPGVLELDADINPVAARAFIKQVRRISAFAVLDLPHMWAPWVQETLRAADDVVIVATPDLASLRDAKKMLDSLKAARPEGCAPRVVLSMVGIPKRPEILARDFAESLEATPSATFAFDPALFDTAALRGHALSEVAPRSVAARAIAELASSLTGREAVKRVEAARVVARRSRPPAPAPNNADVDRPFTFAPPQTSATPAAARIAHPAERRAKTRRNAPSGRRGSKKARPGFVRVGLVLIGLLCWCVGWYGDGRGDVEASTQGGLVSSP